MESLVEILNTNAFAGLATLLTGGVAIGVYFHQKRDRKIQAARVLITEIRIAEERIDQIRVKLNDAVPTDLPPIFPTKSWKQYSHLFISDFDQDELKLLNSFYDYAELVEEFAKRDNEFFWVTTEERAKVTVQKIADFACDVINDDQVRDKDTIVQAKRNQLSGLLDRHNTVYSPQKSIDAIKKIIPNVPKITTASCGMKLKSLAKLD